MDELGIEPKTLSNMQVYSSSPSPTASGGLLMTRSTN